MSSQSSLSSQSDYSIKFLGFNQNKCCFVSIDKEGFKVFPCNYTQDENPLNYSVMRCFLSGTLKFVEMLYKTNIFVLVGGGVNPLYPPNKAIIWDDKQAKCIGELSFRSEIRAIRLKKDRIIIVLEHKVYTYNFADLTLLGMIETFPNPGGICSIAQTNNTFATLSQLVGSIVIELYDSRKTTIIEAHQSKIECIVLNNDGSLIASSSESGTLIRVFNTNSGTLIKEFRRGLDRCKIYCLVFNNTSTYLAVSSDKATCHVFSLTNVKNNTSSMLSVFGLKNILPDYFSSEWSFVKFILPENQRSIVTFIEDSLDIIVISLSGNIYYYKYNEKETSQDEYTLTSMKTFKTVDNHFDKSLS